MQNGDYIINNRSSDISGRLFLQFVGWILNSSNTSFKNAQSTLKYWFGGHKLLLPYQFVIPRNTLQKKTENVSNWN